MAKQGLKTDRQVIGSHGGHILFFCFENMSMASKGDFIRKIEFKNQRISRDKWIFFGILFSITNEISFTNSSWKSKLNYERK